jgi:hypothetical protein
VATVVGKISLEFSILKKKIDRSPFKEIDVAMKCTSFFSKEIDFFVTHFFGLYEMNVKVIKIIVFFFEIIQIFLKLKL